MINIIAYFKCKVYRSNQANRLTSTLVYTNGVDIGGFFFAKKKNPRHRHHNEGLKSGLDNSPDVCIMMMQITF